MIIVLLSMIAGSMLSAFFLRAFKEADDIRRKRSERMVNIESNEQLDRLIASGFQITGLEIGINDASKLDIDPLDMTIRSCVRQAAQSRAAVLRGALTFADREKPEIMYAIILTSELVEKAWRALEDLEEKEATDEKPRA